MLFRFYCDESYGDSRNYVVAGFFSDERTWGDVEKQWAAVNRKYHVKQFHASCLNGRREEYKDWGRDKQIAYSAELLEILASRGRLMHVVSCGIMADEYETVINAEGRKKLGHPYLACFKTCIALMAKEMDDGHFPPEDRFAVILDRNPLDIEATKSFYQMKDDQGFLYRHRLETCTPAEMSQIIPLQPGDLIAYEVFKAMGNRRDEKELRFVLEKLFSNSGVSERIFGVESLKRFKEQIENAQCDENRLVFIPT